MPRRAELELEVRSGAGRGGDRDDGAQLRPAVQHAHAGHAAASRSRAYSASARARSRAVSSPTSKRVLRRVPDPEHQRVGDLPALEPPGVRREAELVGVGPVGAVHVHQERVRPRPERAIGDVQEADARGDRGGTSARSPRGSRSRPAPRRPASVPPPGRRPPGREPPPPGRCAPTASTGCTSPELVGTQVRATRAGRRRANAARTASGSMPPSRAIGRPDHLDAEAAGQRQVHDLVRGVVGPAGEDARRRAGNRTRRGPGRRRRWSSGRARCCRRGGAEQAADRGMSRRHGVRAGVGRLVAAELGLEPEVVRRPRPRPGAAAGRRRRC